jgi:hypothetical protein
MYIHIHTHAHKYDQLQDKEVYADIVAAEGIIRMQKHTQTRPHTQKHTVQSGTTFGSNLLSYVIYTILCTWEITIIETPESNYFI